MKLNLCFKKLSQLLLTKIAKKNLIFKDYRIIKCNNDIFLTISKKFKLKPTLKALKKTYSAVYN